MSGFAAFGCSSGTGDDPCDFIVTVEVTALLDADSSPVPGATVYIDTGPPDAFNTKVTDPSGKAFFSDTSFLTGFSAECGGEEVGTVLPYETDTAFTYDLLVTAPGLAPAGTVLAIDRQSRDIAITVRMQLP